MSDSPPRSLYDYNYYKTSCEGFNDNIENLSPRLSHFESWIAPKLSGKVLDLGFGRGELSIKAARLPSVERVIAVDYSYDAVHLFMENLKGESLGVQRKITQICDDIENFIPFLTLRVSHIIAFDVIEHIYPEQVTRLFSRLSNLLNSGGTIYVVTPLSEATPNERHVWLARNTNDISKLLPECYECIHMGYTGSGEDHKFEIRKR